MYGLPRERLPHGPRARRIAGLVLGAGLLLGLGMVGLLAPGAARAQRRCEPTDTDIQEAQALFVAGAAAIDAGRWSDAIDSFSRAYTLTCAPSALYNYGVALRALGRHREARDAFDRLLTDHPDLGGETRDNAVAFRGEEAARVAVLELVGVDPEARPELSLDGRAIADSGARPITLETDAGSHSVIARIPEHQPFVWEGELADGQRERVPVVFAEIPAAEEGGVDPLAIIIPVLVAAAIAGGVTAGILLQEDAQLAPDHPTRLIRIGTP